MDGEGSRTQVQNHARKEVFLLIHPAPRAYVGVFGPPWGSWGQWEWRWPTRR